MSCSGSKVGVAGVKESERDSEVAASDGDRERDPLAPLDAPQHSLRGRLLRCMTINDVTVKRLAAEFVYEVCSADGKFPALCMFDWTEGIFDAVDEFVLRAGLGNAAAFLQGRGLLAQLQAGFNTVGK